MIIFYCIIISKVIVNLLNLTIDFKKINKT